MAKVGPLEALVDIGTVGLSPSANAAVASLALAAIASIHVDAVGIDMAIGGLRCGKRRLERALVDVPTEEAVAPIAGLAANARIAEGADRPDEVGARRVGAARVQAVGALIDIGARDPVACVAGRAYAAV